MKHLRRRFLGLCLLPILLTCLDCVLTLAGQSKEYWSGDFTRVNEGSSYCHKLLAHHPLAFVAGEAALLFVYIGLILLTPQPVAMITSISMSLGHWAGASSWFLLSGKYRLGREISWGLALLTVAGMVVGCWWVKRHSDTSVSTGQGFVVRWGATGVLSSIWLVLVFLTGGQGLLSWIGRLWPLAAVCVYCLYACLSEMRRRKRNL